jgi:GNAT superfamily N-acetyltransferase
VWILELIIAAISYSATWSPKIDVYDAQLIGFNISGDSSFLIADVNFTVGAREFSRHPSYEKLSVAVMPSFRGWGIGTCNIPRFRRQGIGYHDTLLLPCELQIDGDTFDDGTRAALQYQLDNGILLLDVRVIMTVYPRVYLAFSAFHDQICNIIFRPPSASNSTTTILRQYCIRTPQTPAYGYDGAD